MTRNTLHVHPLGQALVAAAHGFDVDVRELASLGLDDDQRRLVADAIVAVRQTADAGNRAAARERARESFAALADTMPDPTDDAEPSIDDLARQIPRY